LPDGSLDLTGALHCDPLLAGRYLCDSIGKKTISAVGYSLVFDNLNDRIRPTRGQRLIFSQDFAGLGGNVRYIRSRGEGHKYWGLAGFILSANGEAGYVLPLSSSRGAGVDKVRLTDRFFLGSPDFAGFDIRGIGPRVLRRPYLADGTIDPNRKNAADDALGGRAYYFGKLELQIPLGNGAKELGLRPSLFANIGSVFGVKQPPTTASFADIDGDGSPDPIFREIRDTDGSRICISTDGVTPGATIPVSAANQQCDAGTTIYGNSIAPFSEQFLGNTWKPRISVGIGVNWNSPFGPFRIDIAKALVTRKGDDPKLFSFNVGTQF
jgi:outer membrane protein insertion porin family